jgi:hypothetical protein
MARALGHHHPFDVDRITDQVTAWANYPAASSIGGQVVLLAGVLAGAATVGLVAQALGSLIERTWLAADWHTWPRPLRRFVHRWVVRRQKGWEEAAAHWHRLRENAAAARARGQRVDPVERHAAHRAMTRIAPEYPDRPTWSGDRLHAVAVRLERDHQLGLAAVWPHLWLFLPEEVRSEIASARQALTRANTLAAWTLLYLLLAIWWWPAVLVASVLTVTSRWRTRTATDVYAALLEATTRLHARDLAQHLGLSSNGSLTPELGDELTRLLEDHPMPPP